MTSTFFTKSDERKSGDKKEKNGAHTHVRTTVQLEERNIHVGCCLFSHDQNKKKKSKKNKCCRQRLNSNNAAVTTSSFLKVMIKKRKKTKNGAHTYVCTTVQLAKTQYSRQLLSILAQPILKKKNKKEKSEILTHFCANCLTI